MQKKSSVFAVLIVLFVCMLCIGCAGEPKIDTSSDQAFTKSIAEIYKAMPEADKAEFGKYLMAVMAGEINSFSDGERRIKEDEYDDLYSFIENLGGQEAAKYLDAVNGLTAAQIQEQGKAIWKAYLEKLTEEEAKAREAHKSFFDSSGFKKQSKPY